MTIRETSTNVDTELELSKISSYARKEYFMKDSRLYLQESECLKRSDEGEKKKGKRISNGTKEKKKNICTYASRCPNARWKKSAIFENTFPMMMTTRMKD